MMPSGAWSTISRKTSRLSSPFDKLMVTSRLLFVPLTLLSGGAGHGRQEVRAANDSNQTAIGVGYYQAVDVRPSSSPVIRSRSQAGPGREPPSYPASQILPVG